MNIWHDINPERIKKNNFISVIEISGSQCNNDTYSEEIPIAQQFYGNNL